MAALAEASITVTMVSSEGNVIRTGAALATKTKPTEAVGVVPSSVYLIFCPVHCNNTPFAPLGSASTVAELTVVSV